MKYTITFILTLIVLWQGGFSDTAWLVCGVLAAIFLIIKIRIMPPLTIILLFAGLIGSYILSTLLNGSHIEGWINTAKIMIVLLWVVLLYNCKSDIEESIFISGLIAAVVSILSYCGLLPGVGIVSAERLHGTFQYANTFALYLGICALLTRISKKAEKRSNFVILMEIALFLTKSVGGISVFASGLLLMYITQKDDRKTLYSQLPAMMFSLICSGIIVIIKNYSLPYVAVLPIMSIFFLKKTFKFLTEYRSFKWIALGIFILFGVFMFYRIGNRPINTYTERLIQISDGLRTVIKNPFGIGPGAWAFEVYARQSAFYDAVLLHSDYVTIGVAAGIPAIVCFFTIIFYKIKHNRSSKYNIAVYMILFHSLFDFSLSFFAIIILLILLSTKHLPEKEISKCRINIYKLLLVPCLVFCILLIVPRAVINNAKWTANNGDYKKAAEIINTPFLKYDTEALLLRLQYTAQITDYEQFDTTFDLLQKPNAEAYYLMTRTLLQRGKICEAAEQAKFCALTSPYLLSGYNLMEEVKDKITNDNTKEKYVNKISDLRNNALKSINPLAKYIPDDRGLH